MWSIANDWAQFLRLVINEKTEITVKCVGLSSEIVFCWMTVRCLVN